MEIITEMRNDYIFAHINGHFSLTPAQNLLVKSMDNLVENSCSKLLIDITSMNGNISIIERFLFGEFCALQASKYREKGLKHLKIAILGLEPMIDHDKFSETVARNRGVDLKVTTDINSALQFLGNGFVNNPTHLTVSQSY